LRKAAELRRNPSVWHTPNRWPSGRDGRLSRGKFHTFRVEPAEVTGDQYVTRSPAGAEIDGRGTSAACQGSSEARPVSAIERQRGGLIHREPGSITDRPRTAPGVRGDWPRTSTFPEREAGRGR
jgi:hypothetical protein